MALSSKAHGSLDPIENGQVKGWAVDPERPSARVTLDVSIDGKPFDTVVADQHRADLLAAGLGDGYHAFFIDLPAALIDGRVHSLEIRIAGTKKALQHSPRVGVFAPPPGAPGSAAPPPEEGPVHPRTLPDSRLSGLSVVIATETAERLERSLLELASAARNQTVEFVIVLYGADQNAVARVRALAARIPNIRWEATGAATPGLARNRGVALATHEVILFLGDDVAPAVATLFEQHIHAHRMLPGRNVAVLGKIVWPNHSDDRVSFLMAHVQGTGGQQFGFGGLLPYTWVDWRFFHPDNVSFKRGVLKDWATEGYSAHKAPGAALEDPALAWRLDAQLEGGFQILYYPGASVTHASISTVRDVIERRTAVGLAARVLFAAHPKAKETLGVGPLDTLLAAPRSGGREVEDDLLRMMEGAKSWGVVIEANYALGSQNWHADLLNAIFELSFLQGYVAGCAESGANFAAAYRYCLERFQEKLSTAAAFEVFGRFPSFTVT